MSAKDGPPVCEGDLGCLARTPEPECDFGCRTLVTSCMWVNPQLTRLRDYKIQQSPRHGHDFDDSFAFQVFLHCFICSCSRFQSRGI